MDQGDSRYNYRDNNRIIAGLLAFIAGTFGVHRFYLNDIGGGIFYIFLFFVTIKFFPVTMILGIIEAMRLFKMSPEEFDEKYNKIPRGKSRRFGGANRPSYRRPRDLGKREMPRRRTNGGVSRRPERKRSASLRRNPFKSSGLEKYKDFDLQDAISDFHKALKLSENDPEIHFYLAAAYSLTEQKDKAFRHLELAVSNGLKDPERIETFEDLAFVRIQDEFESFRENGYRMKSNTDKEAVPEEDILDDDVLLSQLNKLDELRKKGLISQEEFMMEKSKLIEHKK